VEAARQAICSPLIEERGVSGATRVLVNITGSSALALHDVSEACRLIREATGREDVVVNFGLVLQEGMRDAVKVTVIATGFNAETGQSTQQAAADAIEQAPVAEFEEPAPLPLASTASPDDLDVPAYLRQRKLIQ